MFALKDSLRSSVRTRSIATDRTLLRSVAAVNIINSYSFSFGLVSKKLLKLEEIPFVQLFALFFPKPGCLSNRLQIFKYNYISWLHGLNNMFADHVINIGPKTVLLLRKLTKVPFGRFTTTRLKFSPKFFITAGNMFNMAATKKLVVRGYSNVINAPVCTNNLARKGDIGDLLFKDNMQENAVFPQEQVSGSPSPVKILFKVCGHDDGEFLSAVNSEERNFVSLKPDIVTPGVIPHRAKLTLGTGYIFLFLKPVPGGFKRFRGFHPCGDCQLGREVAPCGLICFMVQRDAIKIPLPPPHLANVVKSGGIRFQRWFNFSGRDIEFEFNGAC